MQLGKLATECHLAQGISLGQGVERVGHPMRRFVQQKRPRHRGELRQTARSCRRLRGKKPSKKKWSQAMPELTSAVMQAVGPGMTSTATSAARAASTST